MKSNPINNFYVIRQHKHGGLTERQQAMIESGRLIRENGYMMNSIQWKSLRETYHWIDNNGKVKRLPSFIQLKNFFDHYRVETNGVTIGYVFDC